MPLPENEAFNIKFVEVESYKCLYDITSQNYCMKDEQDRAWNLVAQQFSSTSIKNNIG